MGLGSKALRIMEFGATPCFFLEKYKYCPEILGEIIRRGFCEGKENLQGKASGQHIQTLPFRKFLLLHQKEGGRGGEEWGGGPGEGEGGKGKEGRGEKIGGFLPCLQLLNCIRTGPGTCA